MRKAVLAGMAALLMASAPVAQAQTGTAHSETSLIGMPIYTSDGIKIGQVTTLGTYRGESSMIGEVGRFMGFGTRRVLIPDMMATVENDRVTLTITSDRVSELLEPGQ